MKLENAGTWRMDNIMKKFDVDRDTARRLKAGEDVEVVEHHDVASTDANAAESEGEE